MKLDDKLPIIKTINPIITKLKKIPNLSNALKMKKDLKSIPIKNIGIIIISTSNKSQLKCNPGANLP